MGKYTAEEWRMAADDLRPRIDEYLRMKGIDIGPGGKKPFLCLNPDHNDRHPSMSLDSRRHRVHCFPCKASYDLFDLIGMDYNLQDNNERLEKAMELFNYHSTGKPENRKEASTVAAKPEEKKRDLVVYFKRCRGHLKDTSYWANRGLSLEVLERHMVGYDPEFMTKDHDGNLVKWPMMIFPTGNYSCNARHTDPNAVKDDRYRKRGDSHIFNAPALRKAQDPIFVVEGEIDALSIEEAGGVAIALGGMNDTGAVMRALQELEGVKPAQPLIIALDHEKEPDKAAKVEEAIKALEEGLDKLGITHYRSQPQGEYKDANEALMADRESFTQAVQSAIHMKDQAAEEAREDYFQRYQVANYMQKFLDGITASVNTPCTSTGFKELDQVLDGGLYEGLYIIGAISSLGKTTLVTQIADQIAASGRDVLIFSLEMARAELISKSISRHTLQGAFDKGYSTNLAKTARGITDGKRYDGYNTKEQELIREAMKSYSAYSDHIFIVEGVGDIGVNKIREMVEAHILYTGGKWTTDERGERILEGGSRPVVVVDYFQIMAPYSERMSDKQNTDKAVLELKRISRDYKLPLIGISSFNRMNYNEAVSMEAFKESGSIEYSSDVLIGLQLKGAGEKNFNPLEEKKKNPREVELIILKNRNGKVGDRVQYKYYPLFNYFKEA